MSQRNRLPAADRELLARLEQEAQDPAERARRRRLFDGDLTDYRGSCKRADEAMAALLTPAVGGDLDRRDRIVLLIVWGTIRDQDVEYFAPLDAPAPAPRSPTIADQVFKTACEPRAIAPRPTAAGDAVPTIQAQAPAPTRAPCAAAASEFLRAALAAGERESREVQAEGQRLGLTPAMIRAARQRLGIVAEKRGFSSLCRSYWRLPESTGVHSSADRAAGRITDRNRSASRTSAIEAHNVHQESAPAHVVRILPGMERKDGQDFSAALALATDKPVRNAMEPQAKGLIR